MGAGPPTEDWHPQRDSNPCYRRERAGSWAARRWGPGAGQRVEDTIRSHPNDSGRVSAARAGSSVGTSVRLKSGRSAVRTPPLPTEQEAAFRVTRPRLRHVAATLAPELLREVADQQVDPHRVAGERDVPGALQQDALAAGQLGDPSARARAG